MSKSIITSDGLKIVTMLAMLVIILAGIKVAAAIVVPLILSLFIAVILNPVVRSLEKLRIPRVLAVSLLLAILVVTVFLLTSYLATALNELARTLPCIALRFLPHCRRSLFGCRMLGSVFLSKSWRHMLIPMPPCLC